MSDDATPEPDGTPQVDTDAAMLRLTEKLNFYRKLSRRMEKRAKDADRQVKAADRRADAAEKRADEAEHRFNELDKKLVAICQICDM